MRETELNVTLLARPALNHRGVASFLEEAGAPDWKPEAGASEAERLVEMAGRACYRSWEPGLNKNVTKVRTEGYIPNVIKQGHGSVLEHAQYSFGFQNVSRVFTHELVRHRAGVAISQESLRYVRLDDLSVSVPPELAGDEEFVADWVSVVEDLSEWQKSASERFGLDDDGTPFVYKKQVTSALRRLAPMGLATSIIWSANVRTLRHVIEMRTSVHAEQEIRRVFDGVAEIMKVEAPLMFGDFWKNERGEWVTEHSKV